MIERVAERKEIGADKGMVTFETRVLNQHGKLVLTYFDSGADQTPGRMTALGSSTTQVAVSSQDASPSHGSDSYESISGSTTR